jgi:DNA polymerase-3 subunit beta
VKLTVHSAALAELAELGKRVVPIRASTPVLGCVVLAADADRLRLTATDYDTWAVGGHPATVLASGRAAVGARLLHDVARAMPAGDVELLADGSRLTVRAAGARAVLPTLPVEDYPAEPAPPAGPALRLPGTRLGRVLEQAAKMAGEPVTPQVHKVMLDAGPEGLQVAATDKYRLLVARLPWTEDGPAEALAADLLPDAALLLAGLSKDTAVALQFPAGGSGVLAASADGRRLYTRLADPQRVAFERFLDSDPPHRLVAPTAELAALVKQASRFCEAKGPVRLSLADGVLTVAGGADDEGFYADSLDVQAEDWPDGGLGLAFNGGYLASLLDAVPAETVCVAVSDAVKPARITAAGAADYPMTGVLMPVRLPGGTR